MGGGDGKGENEVGGGRGMVVREGDGGEFS